MALFGTDGVRGRAGEKINAMAIVRLAMATGIYFKKNGITNKIVIGKDTRRSGYMVETAMVAGLTAVGYNVIQIGPLPTPATAFIGTNMRCDGAVMISASHNPYYDNGVKFFDANGNKLSKEVEEEIAKIYNDDKLIQKHQQTHKNIGRNKRIEDAGSRYIVHIKNSFPQKLTLQGVRVVVDPANGAGYKVARVILEELGADVKVINNQPDGYNINDMCGAMYPKEAANYVKEYRADLGIALDGDADRIVLIDENGEIVNGDHLMGALALHLKNSNMLKGNSIVTTIMSNTALDDFLAKHGIKTYRSAVGDKNVAELMQKVGTNFGGEESGHIIFSDYSKTGDGILSGLQALAMLLTSGKRASEIFRPFELYPQLKENLDVQNKIPLEQIKDLDKFKKEIEDNNIRHLFRYSGTENKIRLLLEGEDKDKLSHFMNKSIEFFKKALSWENMQSFYLH